jgi:ugpQ protein
MDVLTKEKEWNYPIWFAHRGGGNVAPENTMPGFKACYRFGFRAVEFDVQLCCDKAAVVIHDHDLFRVANDNRSVSSLKLADLVKINVAAQHPTYKVAFVPSFEEVANFCVSHNVAANIEIKPNIREEEETAILVGKAALHYWQRAQVRPLFSSFSLTSLKALQQHYPDTWRGYLIEEWPESDEQLLDTLKRLDCVSLHAPYKVLTQRRINKIKQAGFAILCWTVNDLNKAKQLLNWGVHGIITDMIDKVEFASDKKTSFDTMNTFVE